jgi:hypothetical protein
MSEILGSLFKMLVMALGVAAVGVILYLAFGSNKLSDSISQQTLLQANIQSAYAGQGTFTSLSNAVVIAGNLAPAKMVVSGALQNAWNGAITVAPDATAGQFDVTHAGVPKGSDCQKFATSQNVVSVSINGTVQSMPLEAGALINACSLAANTVQFVYAR